MVVFGCVYLTNLFIECLSICLLFWHPAPLGLCPICVALCALAVLLCIHVLLIVLLQWFLELLLLGGVSLTLRSTITLCSSLFACYHLLHA
jgi:hypothetical protein